MLATITDESREECDRMLAAPLAKNQLLAGSKEHFEPYGISHPLGDNFRGIYDFIPTKYDKKTLMEAYEKIPLEMSKDYYLNGTPEELIEKVEKYIKIGAKHIVFFDTTTVCDVYKMQSSALCIKKVLDYFKGM